MVNVWIVESGEKHAGGSVRSVHGKKQSAMAAALKVSCSFAGGWTQIAGEPEWENGCDYVRVRKFKVL
jgi:hypothetical protein